MAASKNFSQKLERSSLKYPLGGVSLSRQFKDDVTTIFLQRTNLQVTSVAQLNAVSTAEGLLVYIPKDKDCTRIMPKNNDEKKSEPQKVKQFGSFEKSILIEKSKALKLFNEASSKLESVVNDMISSSTGSIVYEQKRSYNQVDLDRIQSWIRFLGHGMLCMGVKPSKLIYRLMFSYATIDNILYNDMSRRSEEWYDLQQCDSLVSDTLKLKFSEDVIYTMFEKVSVYGRCTELYGYRSFLLVHLNNYGLSVRDKSGESKTRVIMINQQSSDSEDKSESKTKENKQRQKRHAKLPEKKVVIASEEKIVKSASLPIATTVDKCLDHDSDDD